jgi:hypothetical protein
MAVCGCASPAGVVTGGTGGQGGAAAAPGTGGQAGSVAGSGGTGAAGGLAGGGGVLGSGGFIAGTGGTFASGGSGGGGGSASPTGGRGGSGVGGQSGAAGYLGAGGTGGATATGGAGGGNAGASGAAALLVPAEGALLGAFVGTGTLASFESQLGRKVAINHNFVGWNDDFTSMLPGLAAGGRIPLVTWEAWENSVGAPLTSIIGGTYDAMITARAQAVKAFGQKFFLRWGHEMNGNWYPWDGAHNGVNLAATTTFVSAYRHIHDLFVAAGATNALWVFCPNVDSVPGDSWNQWQNYYPGDAYVDWMGFDGYNWGTVQSTSTWQTFPTIAGRIYSSLATKGKPIMIPETASTELGGDKAAWIAAILPSLKSTFPGIKALVWFQMNKETDWRIDSSPKAQAAFITLANDPYFNP